jgi:hypothetical protein
LVNDQIASLKNEKSIAQESLTRLEEKYIKILSKTITLFGLALQLLLRQPKTLMSPLAMVEKDAIKLI